MDDDQGMTRTSRFLVSLGFGVALLAWFAMLWFMFGDVL